MSPPCAERGPGEGPVQIDRLDSHRHDHRTSDPAVATLTEIRAAVYEGFVRARAMRSTCALLTGIDQMHPDAAIDIARFWQYGAIHLAHALEQLEAAIEDLQASRPSLRLIA